jgi:hypothetical protein
MSTHMAAMAAHEEVVAGKDDVVRDPGVFGE